MEKLGRVADDLFELVLDIDPARTSWERISSDAARRARDLAQEAKLLQGELGAALQGRPLAQALVNHLASASARLLELADTLKERSGEARWRAVYSNLARSYEDIVKAAVAAQLSTLGRFRRLSPANHARSFFHASSGLFAAACYHWLLDRRAALLIMGTCVIVFSGLELLRRYSPKANDAMMRFPIIRRVARAHEYYRINSATFYAWGLLLAVLFGSQVGVEAGLLVLAFGDPIASYVGRRHGKLKLYRDKSVVGSLAFVIAGFLAVMAFQWVAYPDWGWAPRLSTALVAAIAGAVAEVFTFKLDDNFSVPLATALAVSLL